MLSKRPQKNENVIQIDKHTTVNKVTEHIINHGHHKIFKVAQGSVKRSLPLISLPNPEAMHVTVNTLPHHFSFLPVNMRIMEHEPGMTQHERHEWCFEREKTNPLSVVAG